MKNKLITSLISRCGKTIIAGLLAFTFLTLFSVPYNTVPEKYRPKDMVTDQTCSPHKIYMCSVEGFGYGKTNNEGYYNSYDYSEGMPVDILIMGSSHMEALQIPMSCSTASLLGNTSGKLVYNIGFSGHNIYTCSANLNAAVVKYNPSEFVVLETQELANDADCLSKVLSDQWPQGTVHDGIVRRLLRSNPYLYLVFSQIKAIVKTEHVETAQPVVAEDDLVSDYLATMSSIVSRGGVKLIIAYHPATTLEKDGSITFSTTEAEEDAFAGLCAENGVYFLDMRGRFQEEYDENHILPYGFSNTSVGSGHLNRYGHEMMAEELYALMQEVGL